nr:universal stress protein [Natronococcus pandeyae]
MVRDESNAVEHDPVDRHTDEIFEVVKDCFESAETPVSTEARYGRDVAEVILEAAEDHTAASIILTPRERSIWRRLRSQNVLGSLATAAEQPVIIVPAKE